MKCNISKQIIFIMTSLCFAFATILIVNPNIYMVGLSSVFIKKSSLFFIVIITVVFLICINFWSNKIISIMKNSKRESNLELCRVLCMLLIIAHHAIVHGGILNIEGTSTNKILSLFLIPVGKIAFDCFIALSCWFLVDQKFKMNKFLLIWSEVLFYSVSFTIVAYFMGAQLTWRNWFSIFLPISGNSHGFAASYLAFYLLIPFLKKMTQNLTKFQARILLLFLFYFEVCTKIIGYFAQYTQPMASELFVFILIYVLIFNLKNWPIKCTEKKWVMLEFFGLIWIFIWISWYYNMILPGNQFSQFMITVMGDESSITNIIAGVALFFFFKNMKIRKMPLINGLATGTFGILLIHDHNFFRYNFWSQVIKTQNWFDSNYYLLLLIIFVIWTYIIGFLIDYLRKKFIETPLLNLKKVKFICQKYDEKID